MSHEGKEGGAKAPIASRVEAPRAPTTNARREIAGFVGTVGFAICGGTGGALTEGEGVALGGGAGFFSSDMSTDALKQYFSTNHPNHI
ncbi:MAG TPA: hypothetical protein VNA15_10260 [Candidatus Angelobacter sp.]|nr:hypothetical protein [Candidatus Angelobacter sp.]